jgi:PadR family transcriptional regulator, regulatory protein PadR
MEPLARLGAATIDVLSMLLESTDARWGLELIKLTGRPSGTVYPLLDRLERAGWVVSSWDDDVLRPGPRRRMYRLTPEGAEAARDALSRAESRRPTRGARVRGSWRAHPGTAQG